MMPEMQTALITLGSSLSEYAVKGTVTAVQTKVRTIKEEKNLEKVKNSYDEIISELLEEREEIIRIAQSYRAELEKIEISDEDIEHLHNTIEHVLDLFAAFSPTKDGEDKFESIKAFKDLINVDTLKTMQLLGFNYKDAIGIPLTNLCAEAISNFGQKRMGQNNKEKNEQKKQPKK